MKIGIVSDLHGRFHRKLPDAFEGVERILCAGDVEREDIIWHLQTIAPVVCVRGNNDWALDTPITSRVTIEGVRFHLVHIMHRGAMPDDVDVVVFGHTHIPCDEVHDGIRYLNPGSTAYPRSKFGPTCMVADVEDGTLSNVRLIELGKK